MENGDFHDYHRNMGELIITINYYQGNPCTEIDFEAIDSSGNKK
jgi:hypothetical protein